jgi:hypothetical protein
MSGLREIKKLKSWFECSDENMKIGWYSEKQRNCAWQWDNDKACAHIYITPEGKEIIVTEVTDGLTTTSNWNDMKMVGPVVGWARNIYSSHKHF